MENCESVIEDNLFPNRFFEWTGSRDGAVKRPFVEESGRPSGEMIETTLIKKIKKWVHGILKEEDVPKSVFLVGGPGNGKTDAIEFAILELAKNSGQGEMLLNNFKKEFCGKTILPRKVKIEVPIGKYKGVVLVQDATIESISKPGLKKEELLLRDIESYVLNGADWIYLCCVNRGILAHALSLAHHIKYNTEVISLLNHISNAVTSKSNPISAWPLENNESIAVWPMDIESLVDCEIYDGGVSPAEKILSIILEQDNWVNHDDCVAREMCPFAINQDILSQKTQSKNLIWF